MLLPDKYVSPSRSLLGQSAGMLALAREDQTVSEFWALCRDRIDKLTHERFTLALDLLFLLGVVELRRGTLRWTRP